MGGEGVGGDEVVVTEGQFWPTLPITLFKRFRLAMALTSRSTTVVTSLLLPLITVLGEAVKQKHVK